MSFYDDLERGGRGERFILGVIRQKYPNAGLVDGWSYDIFVPEVGKTVEVKTDFISKSTQNVGFEIEYDGEASGILKEFDYWAHIFYYYGWKYFILDGPSIRRLAYTGTEVTGGDGNLSTMLLVPKWRLEKEDYINILPVGKKKEKDSETESY